MYVILYKFAKLIVNIVKKLQSHCNKSFLSTCVEFNSKTPEYCKKKLHLYIELYPLFIYVVSIF